MVVVLGVMGVGSVDVGWGCGYGDLLCGGSCWVFVEVIVRVDVLVWCCERVKFEELV